MNLETISTSAPAIGATRQLGRHLAALTYGDLPDDVIGTACLAIRDIVGVGLFASQLEWSRIAADYAVQASGPGSATIWGLDRTVTAPFAVLANSTAAHGIEMDDRNSFVGIHNGAPTVPTAVALAEQLGSTGRDVILAVVCGYEIGFRVARATRGAIKPRFHPDSIPTYFSSVVAAAKMLRLTEDQLVNAMGIVGGMVGGLLEFANDPSGTMVKRLQGGGWSAYSGVNAALLAAKGLTAPGTILEGPRGFIRSFATSGDVDMDALTRGLGDDFEIRNWETKYYASRGGYSSALTGLTTLRTETTFEADDVASIDVGIPSALFEKAAGSAPRSVMAAQYHLPFVVAVSFFHDLRDPSMWVDGVLDEPPVIDLMRRVNVHPDEAMDELATVKGQRAASRIQVTLRDGTVLDTTVRAGKGTKANPFTREEIEAKFRLLAGRVVPEVDVNRLDAMLQDLTESGRTFTFPPGIHASIAAGSHP